MEDYVKDAVLTNAFHDPIFFRLVELTIEADNSGRPLFPALLQEPHFFRKKFCLWVREALEERRQLEKTEQVDPFD